MSTDNRNSANEEAAKETFDEFRSSFSYGSRTDLLFKFLKSGSEQLADDFLTEILDLTGDLIDNGDTAPIVEAIVRAQSEAYSGPGNFEYDSKPFAILDQPVSESKIALLTTTGHFAHGDDPKPFGMDGLTQEQVVKMTSEFGKADPVLSEIPTTTSANETMVRHGGYDIRATAADRNVSLPIDRMNELADEGVIGEFVSPAYSFVGLASQLRLRKEIAPAWAAKAKAGGAQAAVLIPI
jgi:D-proline reductase (dithiol) PrdB